MQVANAEDRMGDDVASFYAKVAAAQKQKAMGGSGKSNSRGTKHSEKAYGFKTSSRPATVVKDLSQGRSTRTDFTANADVNEASAAGKFVGDEPQVNW